MRRGRGSWRRQRGRAWEAGEVTFPAGLPNSDPGPKGAQWDPAPVPRGPAGPSYSPPCRNSSSRYSERVSHRKDTPPRTESFRRDLRRVPLAPSMRNLRLSGRKHRVSGFQNWSGDWARDWHQILNLLSAGLGLSAKLVCLPAAFTKALRLALS